MQQKWYSQTRSTKRRCAERGLVCRDIRLTAEVMMEAYAAWGYPDLGSDWIQGRKNVFRPYVAMLDYFW